MKVKRRLKLKNRKRILSILLFAVVILFLIIFLNSISNENKKGDIFKVTGEVTGDIGPLSITDNVIYLDLDGDLPANSRKTNVVRTINGIKGGAYLFNGINSSIGFDVVNFSQIKNITESSFSFGAWVKPSSRAGGSPNNVMTIIGKMGYHPGLFYDYNDKYSFYVWNKSGSYAVVNSSSQYAYGYWHHIAGVLNTNTKTVSLYVDGVLSKRVNCVGVCEEGKLRYYGSWPLTLGNVNGTYRGYFFNGTMDEIRIYNRTLSDSEVFSIYSDAPGSCIGVNCGTDSLLMNLSFNDPSLPNGVSVIKGARRTSNAGGKIGEGYLFNGVNASLSIDKPRYFLVGGKQTVLFWFKANSQSDQINNLNYLFSHPATGTPNGNRFYIHLKNKNTLTEMIGGVSGAGFYPISNEKLTDWNFVAVIRNMDENRSLLYLNGVLVNSTNFTVNLSVGDTSLFLGSYDGVSQFFNGTIDEVRIYNKELSASEIQSTYDSEKGYNEMNRCSGSDGDLTLDEQPFIFGVINFTNDLGETENYEDDCIDNSTLLEYYCSGNSVLSENVSCENGCIEGQCTFVSENLTCEDSDEKNYNSLGQVNYSENGNYSTSMDSCIDEKTLLEYFCQDDGLLGQEVYVCPDNYKCSEGSCVEDNTPLAQCAAGEEKCAGTDYYFCENSNWNGPQQIVGKCDYFGDLTGIVGNNTNLTAQNQINLLSKNLWIIVFVIFLLSVLIVGGIVIYLLFRNNSKSRSSSYRGGGNIPPKPSISASSNIVNRSNVNSQQASQMPRSFPR